jgi:uncharacterized RmlC-like cupin family protein
MNIRRSLTFLLASIAIGLTCTVSSGAQSAHILVPADKIQWSPAPPALPAGAQIAVLEGNPSEKGTVVLRLKLPANYSVPAHWHSMTERVTVLSGAFHAGMGDKLDKQNSTPMDPGSFVMLPAKMHHFACTSAPTVVQIDLEGPFDIFYVDPKDNPMQKPVAKK